MLKFNDFIDQFNSLLNTNVDLTNLNSDQLFILNKVKKLQKSLNNHEIIKTILNHFNYAKVNNKEIFNNVMTDYIVNLSSEGFIRLNNNKIEVNIDSNFKPLYMSTNNQMGIVPLEDLSKILNNKAFEDLLNYKPGSKGNNNIGSGEILISSLFNNCRLSNQSGDISVGDKEYEIKDGRNVFQVKIENTKNNIYEAIYSELVDNDQTNIDLLNNLIGSYDINNMSELMSIIFISYFLKRYKDLKNDNIIIFGKNKSTTKENFAINVNVSNLNTLQDLINCSKQLILLYNVKGFFAIGQIGLCIKIKMGENNNAPKTSLPQTQEFYDFLRQ